MSVCPTVSVLRFYGCCHPCFYYNSNKIINIKSFSITNLNTLCFGGINMAVTK